MIKAVQLKIEADEISPTEATVTIASSWEDESYNG